MSKYPYVENAARFARDTAHHRMTVLHDDGLYRHLRFVRHDPETGKPRGTYWFDLITVPGALIFQGDGDTYAFRRLEDMFEFFRQPVAATINPDYWSEKLVSGHGDVKKYDQDLLAEVVTETVAGYYEGETIPDGLMDAIQSEVLDELCGDESLDRNVVDTFEFYANPDDRYRAGTRPDFQFHDIYEWRTRDYDWWFLWACQAITWGIAQYDTHQTARPITSATPRRLRVAASLPCTPLTVPAVPKSPTARPRTPLIVDVHLPEMAEAATS